MVEEPWAGTGGLSEHWFLYFILAIFISYVILLTWLKGEPFRERGVLMSAYGRSPLRGGVGSVDRPLASGSGSRQRVEAKPGGFPH